jgi:hypothetical protein
MQRIETRPAPPSIKDLLTPEFRRVQPLGTTVALTLMVGLHHHYVTV